MKRIFLLFRVPFFFVSLFLYPTGAHGMGLVRAVKKLVRRERPQEQAQLATEESIRATFAQTGLPKELLALVLGYCSKLKLGVITLPDVKSKKSDVFKYPKHSAIQVGLEGDILTVLTTANQFLKYRLPEGILISQNPANLAPGEIYLFENVGEYLNVDDRIAASKVGSVFVSDSIMCPNTLNECYLARIVGNLSELKVYFSLLRQRYEDDEEPWLTHVSEIFVMKRYGKPGICAIYSPEELHRAYGYCYYDNSKLPLEGEQPCTTIEISLQRNVVTRMLNIELPEQAPVVQKDAEQKEEVQDLAGF